MATAAAISGPQEHEQIGKVAGPCVMVLFGASGDLTKRKLVNSLYNLVKAKLLPKTFAVVGVAFDDLTRDQFRDQVTSFLQAEDRGTEDFKWFTERLYYQRGEFGNPATYSTLSTQLAGVDRVILVAGKELDDAGAQSDGVLRIWAVGQAVRVGLGKMAEQ